jgi:hypothetical protein
MDAREDRLILFPGSGRNDVSVCKLPLGICRRYHRSHALEHIVAKYEVVKQSHAGMTRDQGRERPSAEFMRRMKCSPQHIVPRYQLWNLPHEESEWTPAKECGEHARHGLAEKQRVQGVFTQLNRSAMQCGHLRGERRQAGIGQPPSQAKRCDGPDGHTQRSVNLKQERSEVAVLLLGERIQPCRREQGQHDKNSRPVNAYRDAIETCTPSVD